MKNRWLLIKDGKVLENTQSHRIYSAFELKTLLIGCGFKKAKAFGDFAGSPYNRTAGRLVVVVFK